MHISNTNYLLFQCFALLASFIALPSCNAPAGRASFNYGTTSDSALHYYKLGWRQIMDYGQWTAAEKSFRKATQLDSTFLLANAVYGRITSSTAEKKQMLELAPLNRATADQRLLLEIYNMGNRAAVVQLTAPDSAKKLRAGRMNRAERNYGAFVRAFPDQTYEKAEYIEVLHAIHGPGQALDSLNALVTAGQRDTPFFISYAAMLHAEKGEFRHAMEKLAMLEQQAAGKNWPGIPYTRAVVYYQMDSLDRALEYVGQALEMDRAHLIAKGLKKQIEAKQSK